MSAASSSSAKTERLLNLIICLLYTRQPLTKARIREAVPQYGDAPNDEAFDRMFERDKDELRDLGVPLRTEQIDTFFDNEPGYRIDGREYALPEIEFEPDELAVLGLASRAWQQASLAGPASNALRKLRAADIERDDASIVGLEPRVRTSEPAFGPMKDAVVARQAVRFDYRKPDGTVDKRTVQPWAVANWHGRWYVTGHDLDRDASRVFRLSRVEGAVKRVGKPGTYDVPADHDPVAMVRRTDVERDPQPATLRVRRGAGNTLRRRARSIEETDELWSRVEVHFTDTALLADEVAGFGPAVVAVQPPELVAAVIRRLEGVLEKGSEA